MASIGRLVDRVTGALGGGPPAWRDLGFARRRRALWHVRRGHAIPDAEVWAVAVEWARWFLARPIWRRLLRAVMIAIVIQIAIGAVAFPLLWLLPGGEFVVERGWFWVVRSAWQLAVLVSFVAVLPWLDASWVVYLEEPDEPAAPVQT